MSSARTHTISALKLIQPLIYPALLSLALESTHWFLDGIPRLIHLLVWAPAIALHVQYYLHDRDVSLTVFQDKIKFTYKHSPEKNVEILRSEIHSVERIEIPFVWWPPFIGYSFHEIAYAQGRRTLTITYLLTSDLVFVECPYQIRHAMIPVIG